MVPSRSEPRERPTHTGSPGWYSAWCASLGTESSVVTARPPLCSCSLTLHRALFLPARNVLSRERGRASSATPQQRVGSCSYSLGCLLIVCFSSSPYLLRPYFLRSTSESPHSYTTGLPRRVFGLCAAVKTSTPSNEGLVAALTSLATITLSVLPTTQSG
jgi:hypothetical protein